MGLISNKPNLILSYQEEKLSDILEELKPLLIEHWEELANNKDVRPLDPDYPMYLAMNDMDILRIFTVRDDGKLIGYSIWIIANNLHYKTWKYAVSDIYYLDPDVRGTGTSFLFFFKIEDWLKSLGVKSITVQDKLNHSHSIFFNKLGYTPIEQHYEKVF